MNNPSFCIMTRQFAKWLVNFGMICIHSLISKPLQTLIRPTLTGYITYNDVLTTSTMNGLRILTDADRHLWIRMTTIKQKIAGNKLHMSWEIWVIWSNSFFIVLNLLHCLKLKGICGIEMAVFFLTHGKRTKYDARIRPKGVRFSINQHVINIKKTAILQNDYSISH